MLVYKTDVPPGMSWRQAARKAVAMCVSDFAAKGVRPDSFLISLGVPRGTDEGKITELARGFRDASREWNLKLVGGDTNEADNLIVDCTMLGFGTSVVPRSGARPGQVVVTTGDFGYSSAGLKVLLRGAKSDPSFRRRAVGSVLKPRPRLGLGLKLPTFLTSAMDSSDGLAISLYALAEQSGVGITISHLPYHKDLERFANRNRYPVEELVLYGGEEYEIVGTMEERAFSKANKVARSFGGELTQIGRTTDKSGEIILNRNGRSRIERRGWVHLS